MKPSLVIGASGLVGEHLVKILNLLGRSVVSTYHASPVPNAEALDICDPGQIRQLFKIFEPGVVFLPAAIANVDFCETHPVDTYKTNVLGIRNIVEASNQVQARLIYFSTDYIFDGETGPYSEEAVANPISEYGRQKLIAEHTVSLTASDYLILRTTGVYGWERQGKNFVYRLVNSLCQGYPVRVPRDQVGTPTYAPELAASAIQLAGLDIKGVINIAGSSCISRYEFALQAARAFNLPEGLVVPVSTAELDQAAKRPLMAGLKTGKAGKILSKGFLSSHHGLHLMAQQKPMGQNDL